MARVALVTGGSRGIGAAISMALQAAGCKVAATYAGNDAAAAAFKAATGIAVFKWDVADAEACKAGIAAVEAELGPVEILVNNAGITRDATFHRMTLEQWQQVMSTNVDSLFTMTRPVWEGMREPQVRPGDQHQLGQRAEGPVRADQLCGGEGRRRSASPRRWRRRGAGRDHGQLRSARAISAPRWSRRCRRRC